jgi:hypothetical protein
MKSLRATLPALMLVAIACFIQVQAQDTEDKFQITDCRGRSAGICLKGGCTCDEWQLKLFKRDGREWGMITGKTLESVQRQLKKNQDFDVSYARFFGTEVDDGGMNFQHPGKPICRVSCPTARASRSDDDEERRDEIAEAADEIQDKMLNEIGRVSKALYKIERKAGNPYRSVGFVLKDYTNVLKDVFKQQKELRRKLAETSANIYSTMSDIDSLYAQLQTVDERAQQSYNVLPANARGLLESGALETGGAWNNQRIRDFNNSITIQTLDLHQDRITVVRRSETDPASRVTYQLQPGDILTQTIAVQSTDAPDRWMVTFQTNGRRINKRTERDTGALTDNVSKMTLFFSNEQAAREAADALKLNE